MRLAWRLARAQIRHRPLRAFTIAAAVLLATACVTTVVVLDRNTVLTRQAIAVEVWGDPDLVATWPATILADARARLGGVRRTEGVGAVLGLLRVRMADGAPVFLVDGDPTRFRFLDVQGEGLVPGGAVLGPLARPDRVPPRVGGAPVRVTGRAGRRYFAHRAGSDALFLSAATPGLSPDLPVQPVHRIRAERPEEIRPRLSDEALVRDAPHRGLWLSAEDSAMRAAVKVAGLLALVLSAFVLAHVVRVGLLERSRELAVLRALGVPRRRIVRIGLLEAALAVVPAAVAGVPVGTLIAHVLGRSWVSTLGRFRVWFMDFPEGTAALVVLVGVMIPLLGAWVALRCVLRLDAAAALGPVFQARPPTRPGNRRGDVLAVSAAVVLGAVPAAFLARVESAEVEGLAVRAGFLVVAAIGLVVVLPVVVGPLTGVLAPVLRGLFGGMGRIAARTGAGNGRGFRPAVVGVVGVFAVVLTLKNLVFSMHEEIAGWGREALVGRAHLELIEGLAPGRLTRIRAEVPDLVVLPVLAEWRRPFAMRVVDLEPLLETDLLSGKETAAAAEVVAGRGLVASRAFAIRYGLSPGDRFPLATTGSAGPARIVAVTDRFAALGIDRPYLVAGPSFAREHLGLAPGALPRQILAWSRDGRPIPEDDLRGLRAALGPLPVKVRRGESALESRLAKTRDDFRVFDAVWAFLAVLATVGTVGTIFLRALERRRELALLRSLGTTRGQFLAYFTSQGLAVGALGGLLAVVLAAPFTAAAVWSLRRVSGMDVGFVFSWSWAVVCLGLAASLGAFGGLVAALRTRRLDWAAALKYE